MKTLSAWLAAAAGITATVVLIACNKNNSGNSNPNIPKGKSQVSLYMMDGPIQFSKVLIDIRQVLVEVDTATGEGSPDHDDQWGPDYCGWGRGPSDKSIIWDTLDITPGTYDLLQLRNGSDTLLGSGFVADGKILKIQITLGSDNSVFTDSTTSYPLEVFGRNPYITINISRTDVATVTNNEFKLWLDFNLGRSILFWNGEFLLRPYFTVFNDMVMAKVEGQVLPPGSGALVTAYNATDTLYAIPFWNGHYEFRGVPAGTYSVNFKGMQGYQDTTISNLTVDSMRVVNLPTITLHK